MFCSAKKIKADNLKGFRYRFYLCERKRVDGKVKSFDKLIMTLDYFDLTEIEPKIINIMIEKKLKDKCFNSYDEVDKLSSIIFGKYIDIHNDLVESKRIDEEEREERFREEQRKKAEEEAKFYYNKCSDISLCGLDDTTKQLINRIVKEGYRKLSHRFHPDKGGSDEDMQKLNKAKEKLDNILK